MRMYAKYGWTASSDQLLGRKTLALESTAVAAMTPPNKAVLTPPIVMSQPARYRPGTGVAARSPGVAYRCGVGANP